MKVPRIGDLTPIKTARIKKRPEEKMKLSEKEREVFVRMGKIGGTARKANNSAEKLSAIGRVGALARWKNHKKKSQKSR